MSDDEDEYEYDDDEEDDAMEEEEEGNQFEYTDNEEEQDDVGVALENAYYNAKGLRETSTKQAEAALEQVIVMEREHFEKEGNDKQYGPWSFKALKQLVKLHLRAGSASNRFRNAMDENENDASSNVVDPETIMKHYRRLLECISSTNSDVSPAAIEKGINGMLERVASSSYNSQQQGLALAVYDATLSVFHPQTGPCKNERLWFKTNLKYGQLLYEMNETNKLQIVLRDLLHIHGGSGNESDSAMKGYTSSSNTATTASGSTNSMEIYALQIQLYSRMKDTKKLRETYNKAMNVRGGIPHPRTIALIQELGGKTFMSAGDYENGLNAFFQAFKSYDEAGDQSRLRCLKYLVLATMLHASSINPFDSQEARPYRDDPEIMVMTNLVSAFQSNEIHKFERILRQNQSRIMDDEFIREHVEDLLRTIRLQVLRRVIRPYTRISLAAISVALNDVSVTIVENLLVSLIMDGSLDGSIDLTQGVLVKRAERGSGAASVGGGSSDASSTVPFGSSGGGGAGDGRSKTGDDPILMQLDAMNQLVGMLDDLSTQITSNRGLPEPKSNAAGGGSRGMLVH